MSTNLGSENVAARIAHEVPGIDLLVYGHSHKEMADTVIEQRLLMQPKNWAAERRRGAPTAGAPAADTGRWWQSAASSLPRCITGRTRGARATAEGHRAAIRYANTTIGTTQATWRADSARVIDTPLIDFILDVERQRRRGAARVHRAFSLNATLAAGPITVAQIAALYPYDNTLRAVSITGAQLRAYLEQSARYFRHDADGSVDVDPPIPGYNYDIVSGVDYTIDISRPIGERITGLQFNGRPVAADRHLHDGAQQLSPNGRRRICDAARRTGDLRPATEIRQLLIDEVAHGHARCRPTIFIPTGAWFPRRPSAACSNPP